jgi:hypothetical protein
MRWLGTDVECDILVVGGGLGGVAAALAACRSGVRRVVLTEESEWIGGQATSQAVPPDEHPWIETSGCTRSYRSFREHVRKHYRQHYKLSPSALSDPLLNPGNGWVSRLCHEPRVGLRLLEELLAPYQMSGQLKILRRHRPVRTEVHGDRLGVVEFDDEPGNRRVSITGRMVIDATELGDLLALAKVEHVVGAEGRSTTGEPHAPDRADPRDQQSFTWCFALDHRPGEDHSIGRPEDYSFWRDYVPALSPAWPSPLLRWAHANPVTLKSRSLEFNPEGPTHGLNLWTYRRILDYGQLTQGPQGSGITVVNWPQNDYWLGPLIGVSEAEARLHRHRSRQLSRCFLHWMQTEAPRPDGGTGWKGLRLRPDITGTDDGLAMRPYIRESRRIRAEYTVTERDVGTEARMAETGLSKNEVTARDFPDSVGVGAYRIDLHPTAAGRNYLDISSLPFQIPLGSLLPVRLENLLPGAKNLGTTHITNGCYRLHPVEWNIGEAVGSLAAFALQLGEPPRQIWKKPALLSEFQRRIEADGFELRWGKVHPL